jgi:hypothetical protein
VDSPSTSRLVACVQSWPDADDKGVAGLRRSREAMTYTQIMNHVAQAFEVVGVAVLVGGFAIGLVRALADSLRQCG